jgi:RNA polymerase subunit RPABC4/transcription elongation factor Spt4
MNEDRCGKCGKVVSREYTVPERKPCPYCGSMARSFTREFTESIGFTDQLNRQLSKKRGIDRRAEFTIETDSTTEIEKMTVKTTDENGKPITVEFFKKQQKKEGK